MAPRRRISVSLHDPGCFVQAMLWVVTSMKRTVQAERAAGEIRVKEPVFICLSVSQPITGWSRPPTDIL